MYKYQQSPKDLCLAKMISQIGNEYQEKIICNTAEKKMGNEENDL